MGKNVFDWDKKEFTTHVDAMDLEHEKLVAIMNRLGAENEKGTPKAKLVQIIDELIAYTQQHFSREEVFFSTIPNYQAGGSHKIIHQRLIKELQEHAAKYKSSGDRVPEDFFVFLRVWLKAHICGIDRKYGECVKAA